MYIAQLSYLIATKYFKVSVTKAKNLWPSMTHCERFVVTSLCLSSLRMVCSQTVLTAHSEVGVELTGQLGCDTTGGRLGDQRPQVTL